MIRLLEQRLTFKPNSVDHGGLSSIRHERLRFGREFGLDLDGVWMPQDSSVAVLFIHGNRHNITRFADHYELFASLGVSCFAFDFPGYGSSVGTPSEESLYASARAAYAQLLQITGQAPERVAVYGCSLGGAVALELVSHSEVGCVITESTFTNSWEIARFLYPYIPARRFLPCRFNNEARIQNIPIPKLIIHGYADERVPIHMAHTLYQRAKNPKEIVLIPDADHVSCVSRGGLALRETIGSFITNHCR